MTGFSDHSILHYVVTVACGLHVWYIIQVNLPAASQLCMLGCDVAVGRHSFSTLSFHNTFCKFLGISGCYRP